MNPLLTSDQPLWVPAGSVRAFIALLIVGGYMSGLVTEEILLLVIGFYFGQRSGENG